MQKFACLSLLGCHMASGRRQTDDSISNFLKSNFKIQHFFSCLKLPSKNACIYYRYIIHVLDCLKLYHFKWLRPLLNCKKLRYYCFSMLVGWTHKVTKGCHVSNQKPQNNTKPAEKFWINKLSNFFFSKKISLLISLETDKTRHSNFELLDTAATDLLIKQDRLQPC